MQQIGVNLHINDQREKIASINGPQGTGKTTLLKDIFAELVVQQAYEISKLKDHTIKGREDTKYYRNVSIGILPYSIAKNGIIVASSNNGAVKNIVDDLPNCSNIDPQLLEQLIEADYFYSLSNKKLTIE